MNTTNSSPPASRRPVQVVKTLNGNYVLFQNAPGTRKAIVVLQDGTVLHKDDAQFGAAVVFYSSQDDLSNYALGIAEYDEWDIKQKQAQREEREKALDLLKVSNPGMYVVKLHSLENTRSRRGMINANTNWKVEADSPFAAYEQAVELAIQTGRYYAFAPILKCQIQLEQPSKEDELQAAKEEDFTEADVIASDLALGVAGSAWAAIKDGKIVDLVPMEGHDFLFEIPEDFDESLIPPGGDGLRFCVERFGLKSRQKLSDGRTFFRQAHFGSFIEFRDAVIKHLEAQGEVVSGMASCGEFIFEKARIFSNQ